MNNSILFNMIAIGEPYSKFCNFLIKDLLDKTPYDIRVTTDKPAIFTILSSRVTINHINIDDRKLYMGKDFNYNLKYLCFNNIDTKYKSIFYLDCDQQITQFNATEAEELIERVYSCGYSFIGTRTNAILRDSLDRFKRGEKELFAHKILNYNLDKVSPPDIWLDAQMPSEHYFILKNDPDKLNTFYQTWKELNLHTEKIEDCQEVWGDGFEIGIAAAVAGYKAYEASSYDQYELFGIKFNGNKYRVE